MLASSLQWTVCSVSDADHSSSSVCCDENALAKLDAVQPDDVTVQVIVPEENGRRRRTKSENSRVAGSDKKTKRSGGYFWIWSQEQ
jgi:hypothetical protein